MKENIIPVDGMVIMDDTTFAPGIYPLSKGISIGADGVKIIGKDVTLVNQSHNGAAIHAENRANIIIQDFSITGFYHGVRLDHCRNVSVENVRVRDTAEIEGIDTFLYLWYPIDKVYSGAILLNDVQDGSVTHCDSQHQMNGILLYRCSNVTVENNNASFNSGWGVYMSASNDNIIQDNRLDFCNRVFQQTKNGSTRVEADAAGIVIVMSSCRNKILRNSCLCGGDGIFVAGCTPDGNRTSCDENLFEDNDCRLSPNNAIESTFSHGNIFRRNDCSRSNYGFWMGYSWDNVVEDNLIEFNRWVGIAIEHGHSFTIRNNKILTNGEGIRLFTRGGSVLKQWQGWEVSYDFDIAKNVFEHNKIGFNAYTGAEIIGQDGHDYRLKANIFRDNRVGARFFRVQNSDLTQNIFEANVEQAILLVNNPTVQQADNVFRANTADVVDRLMS
ncbi:MAG: right-handed parallel beta-helix repeat-containing protein [Chloroflexota bacterium]